MSESTSSSQARDPAVGPYIPATTHLPEITWIVIVLGVVLSVVLAGANAYLGMFAGMTVSASIPAAVISMGVLQLFRGNILQNNAVQTAASAGESLAAGVIFTLPAMIMLHAWTDFSYIETTMIAGFGGLLGVLFTIPLRRALIVEHPLQFPEGVATAEVLKVGDQGGAGVQFIALAGAVGALFKLGTSGLKLWTEQAVFAKKVGGSIAYVGTNLSPALVAVGFIVRLNIAVLIAIGGAINFLIAIPIYAAMHDMDSNTSAADLAGGIWSAQTRYLGVGAMLVGGFWALIQLRKPLINGIRAGMESYRNSRDNPDAAVPRTELDTPMNWVFVLIGLSVFPLFGLFYHFTDSVGISVFMAVFMLIAGFLFSAVAAYMAGLVGSSNNPISGVTIATILTAALLLLALGLDEKAGPPAAILIGGVVACAAAIGGDNMQDLKCGHIVGSTPRKLQFMQILGVIAAALTIAPVLSLLHEAYVIGSDKLPAPQAGLMSSVAGGVFRGDLPWNMIAIGAGIAVAVIILDLVLEAKKSSFRTPVLAMAVGIYLPFELSVPILIGGLIAHAMDRALAEADEDTKTENGRNGLLFAAGLITGEALIGILLAVPIAATRDADVLAVFGVYTASWPGLILLAAVMFLMYHVATKKRAATPPAGDSGGDT